jgi:hypothetical protein
MVKANGVASGSYLRVVVKVKEEVNTKRSPHTLINSILSQGKRLTKTAPADCVIVERLFTTLTGEQVRTLADRAAKLSPAKPFPDFSKYLSLRFTAKIDELEIINKLASDESIQLAYTESAGGEAPFFQGEKKTGSQKQKYLQAAPGGINACYAWSRKGGDGHSSIKFADIEQGWGTSRKCIPFRRLIGAGLNIPVPGNHGAAVLSIVMMRESGGGFIGIVPRANGFVLSQWRPDGSFNTADAIMTAVSQLKTGDILLLETQGYVTPASQNAWPVEIHPAVHDVIRMATALGICVIEPAGNGNAYMRAGNDLDQFDCKELKSLNPANTHFDDSGAIIVGASTSDCPHRPTRFTNYGKRVNCFAWGENVYVPGRQKTALPVKHNFGGTSSASAMIAGAAIAIQGIMESNYRKRLSPNQLRSLFSDRRFATTALDNSRHIGLMPDLKKIICYIERKRGNIGDAKKS